jgi:hypothetical protein
MDSKLTDKLQLVIDRSKQPVVLDEKINTLRDSFLNKVSTGDMKSLQWVSICVMKPGELMSSLEWSKEFLKRECVSEMINDGLTNNLDSILHYKSNVNLPADLALACLECIRCKMSPVQINMVDADIIDQDCCRIIFGFIHQSQNENKRI